MKEIYFLFHSRERDIYDELEEHFKLYEHRGELHCLSRLDIPAGSPSAATIHGYLERASVIVVLVSPACIADKEHYQEIEYARKLNDSNDTVMVPVLCKHVSYNDPNSPTPFQGLQALPASGQFLSDSGSQRDKVLEEIASKILEIIKITKIALPIPPPPTTPSLPKAGQPQSRRKIDIKKILLLGLGFLLIGGAFLGGHFSPNWWSTPSTPPPLPCYRLPEACPAISDGMWAFDLASQDYPPGYIALKQQIIAYLKQNDYQDAIDLWDDVKNTNAQDARKLWHNSPKTMTYSGPGGAIMLPLTYTNDPELQIYLKDQEIIHNQESHITVVVTVNLSGPSTDRGGSRDILQGVYTMQREADVGCFLAGCVHLLVLIANAGTNPQDAITVDQQIEQAATIDKTIIAIIGWSQSAYANKAVGAFGSNSLPMISPTASDDSLQGVSPYFFSIAPSNQRQAEVAALHALEQKYQHIKVFYDPNDPYSTSLARDFWNAPGISSTIQGQDEIPYTINSPINSPPSIQSAWNRVKNDPTDLIYFAGYASDLDTLLKLLPTCIDSTNCLKVLGGDALFALSDYPRGFQYNRLSFTAFAFADEWKSLNFNDPPFFSDYRAYFDPEQAYSAGPYGWERPDGDVILGYDAVGVAAYAYRLNNKSNTNLQLALSKITNQWACQGISGLIDFRHDAVPNKAVIMLTADGGYTHIAPVGIPFYKGQFSANPNDPENPSSPGNPSFCH